VREVLETFSIKEGRLEIIPLQWKLKIERRFKRRLREDPTSRQKVGLLVRVLDCAKLLPKLGTGNRLLRNTLNLVGNIN
jgi:hypothetical protein